MRASRFAVALLGLSAAALAAPEDRTVDPLMGPTLQAETAMSPSAIGASSTPTPAREAVQAIQSTGQLEPFGASLFTGAAAGATLSPNPNYIIQVGDAVTIKLWGGVTADVTSTVDTQGNVFVPGVGAVKLAGVRLVDLQNVVRQQIRQTYKIGR